MFMPTKTKKIKTMKNLLACLTLVLLFSTVTFAQSDVEYERTLKTMFKVSGSEEAYKTVILQMTDMFKKQKTTVPSEVWDDMEKELLKISINDLVEMLLPIYQKHMTQSDIEELIAFYNTPIGKKFAKKSPLIMQESMQVGQKWGMKIGEMMNKKIKEKGY